MSTEEAQRETTLDEYVAAMPESHRVRKELAHLKDDSAILSALWGAGVDSWEGYEHAMESYREEYPEDTDL